VVPVTEQKEPRSAFTGAAQVIAVAALLAACGAATSESVIVLDDWWSVDFAKATCRDANFNGSWITSCASAGPLREVGSFEDEITTQFAAHTACAGVSIVRYEGPLVASSKATTEAISKPHWSFSMNFIPGARRQEWSMIHSVSYVFTKGEGDPREVARDVCSIAKGQGARILN